MVVAPRRASEAGSAKSERVLPRAQERLLSRPRLAVDAAAVAVALPCPALPCPAFVWPGNPRMAHRLRQASVGGVRERVGFERGAVRDRRVSGAVWIV